MDMRDIEQLHAQYAQPPLTIDISAGVAATAPYLGYSGTSSAPAKASTSPFPFPFPLRGNPRLMWGLGFVAVAAIMFIIGTSIGKRESRASTELVQPLQSASDASARTAAGDGHEWPRKSDSASASEAAQSTALPASAEAVVPAPAASGASAVTVPAEQTRERSPAEPKADAVKRSATAPAPAPARAATVPAPAKTAQQLPTSAAPTRSTAAQHANSPTDIKMF